jgi:outer membrane protein assembly factor BamA
VAAEGNASIDPVPSSWPEARTTVTRYADEYVGLDDATEAYEQESLVYRTPPAFRYNRTEGLVVGLQREPLSVAGNNAAKLYGQFGYATALRDIRYTVGLESRLYREDATALKLGVAYQKQTIAPDRWKTSWAENSGVGIGFEYDFFDYHEAEGVTAYAVQTLPATLRLTAGFRSEDHRTLAKNTDWSVFETGNFRPNPAIDEGRLEAVFASLTGGTIRDREDLPSGAAFRVSIEHGSALGEASRYTRVEGDARGFLRLRADARLGLRLRGGSVTGNAPLQKQFTLGGIGSVRSFEQNAFRGANTLLANAEYIIDGATVFDDVLDDLFVTAFADAGWVGAAGERFRLDDVLPAAGFGVGLDERSVRLDVSWPLRDMPGADSGPSLWLRFTPTF